MPDEPTKKPEHLGPWWARLLTEQGPITFAFLILLGAYTGMLPTEHAVAKVALEQLASIKAELAQMQASVSTIRGRVAPCDPQQQAAK